MRDQGTRRDQREIVVPRDGRPNKASGNATPRRASRAPSSSKGPSEFLATAAACARWTGRMFVTRPGEAFGSLAALLAVGYVSVNALSLQKHAHPAPILPKAAAQLARAEAVPAARPLVVPAQPAEAAAPAASEKPEPKRPEKPASRDAIGDILRADDTTASVTPKAVDTVAQAQRALSKLGYGAIKADGLMGPATKAAIEKFERDKKLPVTGEASGRTLRELAAKAGAAKG
jgi:hypothetical protein